MDTIISHSPLETENLGETWGKTIQPGWVIGMIGGLGAGKTRLVRGLARGLNSTERVHSPTFALLNEYRTGRIPLFHLDLYRLESSEAIQTAGLDEYLPHQEGVTVAEWIEHWLDMSSLEIESPRHRPSLELEDNLPIRKEEHCAIAAAIGSRFKTPFRLVILETLSEESRRICYEDFGC